jgi:tetratricopeptide (TPR) repeat protein
MDRRLIDTIRAVDLDITSEAIADVVWLAEQMRAGSADEIEPTRPESVRPRSTPSDGGSPQLSGESRAGSAPRTPPEPSTSPLDRPEPSRAPQDNREAALRLPDRRLLADDGRISTRSPAAAAIPAQLMICRALQPLRRYVPSPTRTHPDEQRTAEHVAESGLWVAAEEPLRERWLDVAIVVDDSRSMTIWHRTIVELRTLLDNAGVFGDVRVWRMDGDLRHGRRLTISGQATGDTFGRDPRELVDPSGRRVILVVSDCVSRAWVTDAMAAPLRIWGEVSPVALVHMLPQRLWPGCPPTFAAVRLSSLHAGVPNAGVPNVRLGIEGRYGDVGPDDLGVPIPVLEPEARWIKPWASLVAGTGDRWVNGMAMFTGQLARHPTDIHGKDHDIAPAAKPREQLQRFRAQASPEAYKLLVHLSAAPLSLQVIRLVQGAVLPASRPCHLAEVFLSGLLRRAVPDGNDDLASDDVEYDFQPGVRAELLTELARHEALRVLSHVSHYVSERLGSPLDFRALLTVGEEDHEPTPYVSRPFARVAYDVLRQLGGRYEEAAERLTRWSGHGSPAEREPNSPDDDSSVPTEPEGDTLTSTSPPLAEMADRRQGMAPRILHGLPSRNPRFTGRRDLLLVLHQQLTDSSNHTALLPHALHGLGGVGKTQLAIEYVWQYSSQYDLICWVPAEDTAQVRATLAELGQKMGLPDLPDDVRRAVNVVLDALRTNPTGLRWLLVFDNADQPKDLAPYLPYPSGHVLITSRNASWAETASTIEVNVFDRDESIDLLQKRVPNLPRDDADKLAERLGDLPLALEQAAAWQGETGMPTDEYLELFDDQFEQLTEDPPSGYPASLGATYRVTLERLRTQSLAAAQLLAVCSFLGPVPIGIRLLRDGGRHANLPPPLDQTIKDRVSLRAAVREITRYALARIDPAEDQITVHRLVQHVVRAQLDADDRARLLRAAQDILAQANPSEPEDELNWSRHAELSPHILPSALINSSDRLARLVVTDQIRYRFVRGDYESSEELGQLAVGTWLDRWGDNDELVLITQRHLANAKQALGKYDEARTLAKTTLDRMVEAFGEESPHTLTTADMVAWALRVQGDFPQAKQIDERNLERSRRVLGPDKELTLRVAHNLAIDLRWLGDFKAAKIADEESIRLRTEVYGADAWRTLLSVSAVARDLLGLGEYETGLRQQEEALPAMTKILGDLHIQVLAGTRTLGILQRRTGHHEQALRTIESLCETYVRRFGRSHENTLAAMLSYANALRDHNDLDQARTVGEETMAGYQKLSGPEHPFTLASATNLAVVRRHLGDAVSALALNENTFEAFSRVLGPNHPFTLSCAVHVSSDLAMLGRHDVARERSERTLLRAVDVWGEDHPHTFACQLNTALDRAATGAEEEAAVLFEQAVTGFERKLGPEHPETRAAAARMRMDCDIEPPET